jgi:hypothetical protein
MRIRLDAGWAQSQVDRLRRVLPRKLLPHFERRDARKCGDEFSLETIFSILSHLRQPPRATVDYVYANSSGGGWPVPYLLERGAPPLQTFRDLLEQDESAGDPEPVFDALECDRSPEGFFELVLFRTMSMQFYLVWHALYNDATIVAGRPALASTLSGQVFAPDTAIRLHGIDPTPCVAVKSDSVFVHVLTASKHTGLCRESFHFSRTRPNRLRRRRRKVLAESTLAITY